MAASLISSYSISMMHIFLQMLFFEFKVKLVLVDGCFVSEHLDFEKAAPGLILREKCFVSKTYKLYLGIDISFLFISLTIT